MTKIAAAVGLCQQSATAWFSGHTSNPDIQAEVLRRLPYLLALDGDQVPADVALFARQLLSRKAA